MPSAGGASSMPPQDNNPPPAHARAPSASLRASVNSVQVGQRIVSAWEEFRTDEGVPYYYHEETGATTWEHPTLHGGAPATEPQPPPAAAGGHHGRDIDVGGPMSLGQVQQQQPMQPMQQPPMQPMAGEREQELFRAWRQQWLQSIAAHAVRSM